jgi:hypothetical protein
MNGQIIKNRRNVERVELRGMIADIADGTRVFDGYIEDISFGGFKVTHLPQKFELQSRRYVAVLSGYQKNFKVMIQPCWYKKSTSGLFQEVGFKIIQPPWAWMEFVQDLLPEVEPEDVWGGEPA